MPEGQGQSQWSDRRADNLFTQKPITEDDLRLFMMLAKQAGLAIANAGLYELVRHQSHTDSITNVWNYGFSRTNFPGGSDPRAHTIVR